MSLTNELDRLDRKPQVKEDPRSEELLLSYVPKVSEPIISFNSTGVLKPGNILTIVGHVGMGKSQLTEAIVSSYLNPYVDSLGLKVSTDGRPLLWIDGERTKDDIRIGFDRIKKRIAVDENPELIQDDRFQQVYCHPFITFPDIPARVRELERLIGDLKPSLIVLDGAADFVRDVNNIEETTDFVARLVALANNYEFGAVVSVHPNPGQAQDSKPRGWLGSELLRKSEACLLLKRAPDDRDVRILTMVWSHGKNRNAADNLEHYFSWSPTDRMFVSCNYTAKVHTKKAAKQEVIFTQILGDGRALPYTRLAEAIAEAAGKELQTAKTWIKEAKNNNLIFESNGEYRLLPF